MNFWLVVSTNLKKYPPQIGSFPQGSGWAWKIFDLPPPRFIRFYMSSGAKFFATSSSITNLQNTVITMYLLLEMVMFRCHWFVFGGIQAQKNQRIWNHPKKYRNQTNSASPYIGSMGLVRYMYRYMIDWFFIGIPAKSMMILLGGRASQYNYTNIYIYSIV